jgi:GNAT superfamily N-acetyltransferase
MLEPGNYRIIETLRDGREIEIRALRPEDGDGLRAAIGRMSDESPHRRFFGAKRYFTEKEAAYFLATDFVDHVALVTLAEEDDKPTIVEGARYVVVRSGQGKVAFAVIDEYQGKGIGAAMIALASIARQTGLRELIAEVLADNSAC